MKPDLDTLNNALSRGRNKRNNILPILDNIKILIILKYILIIWVQVAWTTLWMRQKNSKENRAQVNAIENRLNNVIETVKSSPTSDAKKQIKNRNNMLEIVELLLCFNQQNQTGQGLRILTPNQILSRLPIPLAQLKQEIFLKNWKTKLGSYFILFTDQKKIRNNSIKV